MKILVVILIIIPALSFGATSNYLVETLRGSHEIINPTYPAYPAKGAGTEEPITGSTIVRESDVAETISTQHGIVYSRFSPTNTTGEYLLVAGDDSFSTFVYRVADHVMVSDLAVNTDPDRIGEINEVRWDYTGDHPTRVYFTSHPNYEANGGMKFYQMDVLTENQNPTLIHDFSVDYPDGAYLRNDVEGDSSADSRYWSWIVMDSNFDMLRIITYDKETDTIISVFDADDMDNYEQGDRLPSPNMVELSPDGTKVLTGYGRCWGGTPAVTGDWALESGSIYSTPYKTYTNGNSGLLWAEENGTRLVKVGGTVDGGVSDFTEAGQYAVNSTEDKLYTWLYDSTEPESGEVVIAYGVRPQDAGTTIDGTYAWDKDFTNPVKVSISETHSGWACDLDKNWWFVSENSADDYIEARKLLDGTIMHLATYVELLGEYEGNGGGGQHYGKFYDTNHCGWVYVNSYRTITDRWSNNQHYMIELKDRADDPRIWRIGHQHNEYADYASEAPAALSFRGDVIYGTANWGDNANTKEAFSTALPVDWADHLNGGTPPEPPEGSPLGGNSNAIPGGNSSLKFK